MVAFGCRSGVVNHAIDVFGVHFYNKVSDSKDEYPDCLERAEQSVQLELSLEIPAFYACEADRAKAVRIVLATSPSCDRMKPTAMTKVSTASTTSRPDSQSKRQSAGD